MDFNEQMKSEIHKKDVEMNQMDLKHKQEVRMYKMQLKQLKREADIENPPKSTVTSTIRQRSN